jgi:peroxin-7
VIAACGNGALKMFDITLEVSASASSSAVVRGSCKKDPSHGRVANDQGLPVRAWHEHQAEIMSVEWSNLQKDTFVTASWDQTVKVVRLGYGSPLHPQLNPSTPAYKTQRIV